MGDGFLVGNFITCYGIPEQSGVFLSLNSLRNRNYLGAHLRLSAKIL